MLARSADNLFWVARYIERADFTARMIDAALRLAALPKAYGGDGTEWVSPLAAAGNLALFRQLHEEQNQDTAFAFLAFDRANPASIRNCIENARNAARAVRTALTVEMWESINAAWLELRRIENERDITRPMPREQVDRFLDFVKAISRDFDGAAYRTMLRNDAYWFNRLGLYVERADNTARILDVKYHLLLPSNEAVGGDLDASQWETILRSVSAHRSYRHVYKDRYRPWNVAEFLILSPEMPRSLRFSCEWVNRATAGLTSATSAGHSANAAAAELLDSLRSSDMDSIFRDGLHEFLTEFLTRNNAVSSAIASDYNFL